MVSNSERDTESDVPVQPKSKLDFDKRPMVAWSKKIHKL